MTAVKYKCTNQFKTSQLRGLHPYFELPGSHIQRYQPNGVHKHLLNFKAPKLKIMHLNFSILFSSTSST